MLRSCHPDSNKLHLPIFPEQFSLEKKKAQDAAKLVGEKAASRSSNPVASGDQPATSGHTNIHGQEGDNADAARAAGVAILEQPSVDVAAGGELPASNVHAGVIGHRNVEAPAASDAHAVEPQQKEGACSSNEVHLPMPTNDGQGVKEAVPGGVA